MSNYIMIYKGEATDTSDMTEEQAGEVMAKWGAWMGTVGVRLSTSGLRLERASRLSTTVPRPPPCPFRDTRLSKQRASAPQGHFPTVTPT